MVGDALVRDVQLAIRTLSRTRGFTVVAVLVLALAIGANGAVFGLVNAVLRSPPTGVKQASSLVWVAGPRRHSTVSVPYFRELRDAVSPALDLAAAVPTTAAFAASGEPIRVSSQLVSANFFSVLGVRAAAGRLFAADEDRVATAGAHPVAVLSHDFWRSQFRADRRVIGTSVSINGQRFDVIGVAAPGFVGVHLESPAALWVPTAMSTVVRAWDDPRLVGRLREGVTPAQAAVRVQTTIRSLGENPRFADQRVELSVTPLAGWLRPTEVASALPVVAIGWAIAGLVLLVVAANVANLMLVRAIGRRREIGVRVALGAGRANVMRLLMIEAVVLATVAGAVGIMISFWGAAWFRARFASVLAPFSVAPDPATVGFTLVLALVIGAAFGAAPAWRASRPDVLRVIKGDQSAWLRRGRLQGTLVVLQVALSVVLVVASGLFVRRIMVLADIDPGFDAAHTVTFSFDPHALRYSAETRASLYERIESRLGAMPGVASVTVPTFVPLGGGAILRSAFVPGSEVSLRDASARLAVMSVGASYFTTLGIRLVEGRDFTARDMTASERTAVVSESFARRWWPNARATGKRFGIDTMAPLIEVIGVARDVAFSGLGEKSFLHAYVPFTQGLTLPETHVVVRTRGAPETLIAAIRAELRAVDPTLPLFNVRTLRQAVDAEMSLHRSVAQLIAGFGMLALLLASLGLYGVVAFGVSSRTREIGIRVALGARPGSVVRLFVRDGLVLTLIGVAVGGVLSAGAARVLVSTVEGLRPGDPLTLVGIALTLTTTAALASWLSARRAGRVDAVVALRAE